MCVCVCVCVCQVCAFSEESDIDMRGKVLLRLRNITELQSLLESCMTGQPARLAQSVEHGTLNPRVVGSSPTSGAHFYFYIFSLQLLRVSCLLL